MLQRSANTPLPSTHAFTHSPTVLKLFLFPAHPPYRKVSQYSLSSLKRQRSSNLLQGPLSAGSSQNGCNCPTNEQGLDNNVRRLLTITHILSILACVRTQIQLTRVITNMLMITVISLKFVGANCRGFAEILQVLGDEILCIFLYLQKEISFITLIY